MVPDHLVAGTCYSRVEFLAGFEFGVAGVVAGVDYLVVGAHFIVGVVGREEGRKGRRVIFEGSNQVGVASWKTRRRVLCLSWRGWRRSCACFGKEMDRVWMVEGEFQDS